MKSDDSAIQAILRILERYEGFRRDPLKSQRISESSVEILTDFWGSVGNPPFFSSHFFI
jgi:hypothetical protein